MTNLTAVLLVGGLGTRLRAVVADRPKPLADVEGRPFLGYLLDQLEAAGVRRAVLCTGYMAESVAQALGDTQGQMALAYSPETEPMGTGGALRQALPLLGDGPVLVMNGDSYVDVDLAAYLAWWEGRPEAVGLALAEVPDSSRFGQVATDDDSRITRFAEKGAASGPGWINAGVYLLDRDLIAALPEGPLSLEREVFPDWLEAGRMAGFPVRGKFLDIGTPETYAQAAAFFQEGQP